MPDFATHDWRGDSQGTDEDHQEMKLTETSESSKKIMEIVVASVLGSLSVAVAPSAAALSRVAGWGIALFDPVSLFWIAAFLIGGLRVGLFSMGAGTIGLFFFDPTGIGPIFKLVATAPMILIPWFGSQKLGERLGGEVLSRPATYSVLMISAFLVRLCVMLPFNLLVVPMIAPFFTVTEIIIIVLTINIFQSIWDALVPYIVVHKTPVFEHFGMW